MENRIAKAAIKVFIVPSPVGMGVEHGYVKLAKRSAEKLALGVPLFCHAGVKRGVRSDSTSYPQSPSGDLRFRCTASTNGFGPFQLGLFIGTSATPGFGRTATCASEQKGPEERYGHRPE